MGMEWISEEMVARIYDAIEKAEVHLDHDMVTLSGVSYMVNMIAKIRNNINHMVSFEVQLSRKKQGHMRTLGLKETLYNAQSDELLAKDVDVAKLPSLEDRRALVGVKLKELKQEISQLICEIDNIEHIFKMVDRRHRELSSTMSELKLQKELLKADRFTGAGKGDERANTDTRDAPKKAKKQPVVVESGLDPELVEALKQLDSDDSVLGTET